MRVGAKRLAESGLNRALSLCGFGGQELLLARANAVDWARVSLRAARARTGVVAGLGVTITRPGRAELRPVEVALAGPGELTVEVLASAISAGTERAQWLRLPNAKPALPFKPGYSGAGRVLAVGRDVEGFAVGDMVAVAQARHASVLTVPSTLTTMVPEGVRVQDAALVYLAIIAGYGVRRADAAAAPGEPLCIFGAGPIGALALRLLRLRHPGPVTVVATSRQREAAARTAGASRFLTAEEATEEIAAAAVVEATGDPEAVPSAISAARPGGTIVLLGSPRGVTSNLAVADVQAKTLRLVGAHVSALATEAKRCGTDPFAELSGTFLDALARGELDVSDLAGEVVDPREMGIFYRRLATREIRAAHIDWSRVPRAERVRRRPTVRPPALRPAEAAVRGAAPARPVSPRTPLRFVVIGCGDIGFANARAVAAAVNADVALCHDTDASLASAAAARFGGDTASTLDEALDPGKVDAVLLSVPHHLHAPLAVRAAQAGLHVLVEKPLAADLLGAERAVEAAAAAGVALSVCFPFRYEPVVQKARALVSAGALGPLRGAVVVFHADKPQSYWVGGFSGRAASGWRASRVQAGGGVLIMNLTHYFDLIRFVTGEEAVRVTGVARTDEGAEVEDAVALSVAFSGGAVGSLAASASTRGAPATRFELWGEVGTLRFEPEPAVYTERAVDGLVPAQWCPLVDEASDDELRRTFVERFADDILAGRPPEVGAADGLAVQVFLDAAYRAIEQGEPVSLPAPEAVPA